MWRKNERLSLVGDVDPVSVGIGHLPFAARLACEKAFAHIGFRAAAERQAGEIGIHPGHFRDPRLERVQILDTMLSVDLPAFESGVPNNVLVQLTTPRRSAPQVGTRLRYVAH